MFIFHFLWRFWSPGPVPLASGRNFGADFNGKCPEIFFLDPFRAIFDFSQKYFFEKRPFLNLNYLKKIAGGGRACAFKIESGCRQPSLCYYIGIHLYRKDTRLFTIKFLYFILDFATFLHLRRFKLVLRIKIFERFKALKNKIPKSFTT